MSSVPQRLVHSIDDKRLRKLVFRVWKRLPACDRHVLRDLLTDIMDDEPEDEPILATASAGCFSMSFEGVPAAEVVNCVLNLTNAKGIQSDTACVYVIAHEFAHVVLRHTQLGTTVAYLMGLIPPIGFTKEDCAALKACEEDQADLQAWTWGFRSEFRAFLRAFPEARRPRWFVELEEYDESSKSKQDVSTM